MISLAKPLMILGTASGVGKTQISVALSRMLVNKKFKVVPFKALNVSLNSYVTEDNLEMSIAQVKQAIACRVSPNIHMNPILLKPTYDQPHLLLQGKLCKRDMQLSITERTKNLRNQILWNYEQIAKTADWVIVEGSGSPVEMNIKERDLSNFWLAKQIDAKCIIVADIDRGGVFASLIGTFALLSEEEKNRVFGFIINKFHGDTSSFLDGIGILEEKLGKPCLGIIPFFLEDNFLEEDSLLFKTQKQKNNSHKLNIGIMQYPNISNSTDFDALSMEPNVHIEYIKHFMHWKRYDLIILPGSKSTISDLKWLYKNNLDKKIYSHYKEGGKILGICGGMQMLGHEIFDRNYVDNSSISRMPGLALLNFSTTMHKTKVVNRVVASMYNSKIYDGNIFGYEMHMGRLIPEKSYVPLFKILNSTNVSKLEGAISQDQRVWGTNIHGLFNTDSFRHRFFEFVSKTHKKSNSTINYNDWIEKSIDRWTVHVQKSLNKNFYEILNKA